MGRYSPYADRMSEGYRDLNLQNPKNFEMIKKHLIDVIDQYESKRLETDTIVHSEIRGKPAKYKKSKCSCSKKKK
jgi:hypothetical protein